MLFDFNGERIGIWAGHDASDKGNDLYLYNHNTDSKYGLDLEKTILAFYTDDSRWENQVYQDHDTFCHMLINAKVRAVVAPNFSTYWDWPQAKRIWAHYKARWCARLWQECGIKVIPDIQLNPYDKDFCLAGIPKNSTVAMQWHVRPSEKRNEQEFLEKKQNLFDWMIECIAPKTILIYGIESMFNFLKKRTLTNMILVNTRESARSLAIKEKRNKEGR